MADLPFMPNSTPTIDKIYQLQVDSQGDWRRDHLGASLIGNECERSLWYDFRWCTKPDHDGRLLRLFETGNREEARILDELVKLRLTVYTRHPNTGRQIHYDLFGGHFGFNLDGIALGFEEAPKSWHVVECKTSNANNFRTLKSKGVREAKWLHYCQMQSYMGAAKLERAYYIAVCKDTDEIYGERVHFEKDLYRALMAKAERVIFAESPPSRITMEKNPTNYKCRWCNHSDVCFGECLPEVTCRTCAHVTPTTNGKWTCFMREDMSSSDQRHPCDRHIFIPKLVPLEQVDADAEKGTITYAGNITNGPGAIPSTELQRSIEAAKNDDEPRCAGDRESGRPYAPYEPDMSGVAYQTEFDPP